MTLDKKLEIFRDRLNGCSYAEIEKKYNVSKKELIQMLNDNNVKCTHSRYGKYVYPELADWINKHFGSIEKYAKAIGVNRTSVFYWLHGRNDISKRYIDKTLELAGMTYEQLYRRSEEE